MLSGIEMINRSFQSGRSTSSDETCRPMRRDHKASIENIPRNRMRTRRRRSALRYPALAAGLLVVFFALGLLRILPDPSASDSEQACGVCQWSDEYVAMPPAAPADPVTLVVIGLHDVPQDLPSRAPLITLEVSARAPPAFSGWSSPA